MDQDLRDKIIETHTIVAEMRGDVKDHETRIRSVEKKTNYLYAWATAIGLGAATGWEAIKAKFGI